MGADYMEILKAIWLVISIISVIFTAIFVWGLIKNIRKELAFVEDVNKTRETVKFVYVEHLNGMYRMYDKFTNHFICQAKTELELWNIARDKFPNKNVMTLKEDEKAKDI